MPDWLSIIKTCTNPYHIAIMFNEFGTEFDTENGSFETLTTDYN